MRLLDDDLRRIHHGGLRDRGHRNSIRGNGEIGIMSFTELGAAADGMVGDPFFWVLILVTMVVAVIHEAYWS